MVDEQKLKIKLVDFGLGSCIDKESVLKGSNEHFLFLAPEIVGRGAQDEKVDVWAAGVLIFMLLSGQPPFRG